MIALVVGIVIGGLLLIFLVGWLIAEIALDNEPGAGQ
jgi:hypothetical protein